MPKVVTKKHDSSFKNKQFSSFWGGTNPPSHTTTKRAIGIDAPTNHPKKIYAPDFV